MLIIYIKHADLSSKLLKPNAPERFSENVTQLQFSTNELDVDQLPVAALPDEMELNINMLTPVMMHRISHQGDGGLVVHLELGCEDDSSNELSQQSC